MPNRDSYRAAATLAITLMSERPSLSEADAIHVAWQSYEAVEPDEFHLVLYDEAVRVAISSILIGRQPRLEPPPPVLKKAREILKL